MRILSVGEILWDVFEQGKLLGGACLNFSANMVRLGDYAALLTAVGRDESGPEALDVVRSLGLSTDFIQVSPKYQTGAAIVTTDVEGDARYSIARPAAFDDLRIDEALMQKLEAISPDWIYFGTLSQTNERSEKQLQETIQRISKASRFYDINLRDGHWNLALVERLSSLATIVKLNEDEAQVLSHLTIDPTDFSLEHFCNYWCARFGVETIVVTMGSDGCAIFTDHAISRYGGFDVRVIDTVGAGDAFSAAFIHGVHRGWPMDRTARFANALGATVASRAGATPSWTPDECLRLMASR